MRKQRILNDQRERRRYRVRKVSRGTAARPRLCVYRSNRNLTVQVVDDELGKTLVSASTQEKDLRTGMPYGGNKNAAQAIGKLVAERAIAAGVKAVCFDRGSYKYHGRVAALADAAREAGLSF